MHPYLAGRPEWITRAAGVAGLIAFVIANVVILYRDLTLHSSTVVPIYIDGSIGWWQGKDIFGTGYDGFIYLPTFAVLFTPFTWLGRDGADIAWRLGSAVLLAYSLERAVRCLLPDLRPLRRLFVLGGVMFLMLPAGVVSLRYGQATTMLYAMMLLGTVAIAETKWWTAAIWLALAFAVKPLAIVLLLLVGALYPKLSWRLLVALIAILLVPLIQPDPWQAAHLYRLGIDKVLSAGDPLDTRRWSDITGLLNRFGVTVSDRLLTELRVFFALVTLGVAAYVRRHASRVDAAFDILALSVVYLMLMCPRTEGQTYLMLGSTLGLYVAVLWHRDGRVGAAWWLSAIALGYLGIAIAFHQLEHWWQPLLCLLFIPFLLQRCLVGADRMSEPAERPSASVG